MLDAAKPERTNRVKFFIAVRAGNTFREHSLLFDAVLALFALQNITDPFHCIISGIGSAEQPEVEPDKMFAGKTEERFNPPVCTSPFHGRQTPAGSAALLPRDIRCSWVVQNTGVSLLSGALRIRERYPLQ